MDLDLSVYIQTHCYEKDSKLQPLFKHNYQLNTLRLLAKKESSILEKGGMAMKVLRESVDLNDYAEDVDDCANFCNGLCCLSGACCKGCQLKRRGLL